MAANTKILTAAGALLSGLRLTLNPFSVLPLRNGLKAATLLPKAPIFLSRFGSGPTKFF